MSIVNCQLFISDHLGDDVAQLALQRRRFSFLSDDDFRWALQQIEARQRLADKLPSFVSNPDFWFPVRLSCEQCSSELTASYKAALVAQTLNFTDLTGGLGIDTLFLASVSAEAHYVERDAELCRLAAHNFALPLENLASFSSPCGEAGRGFISITNSTAEDYIKCQLSTVNSQLYYLDPARRDSHGSKVFRLKDCSPDVLTLLPAILRQVPDAAFLLKLSPMLDISAALADLSPLCAPWQVHVLSVCNEVKEVLFYHTPSTCGEGRDEVSITAIDLPSGRPFTFTPSEERSATSDVNCQLSTVNYIYEPAAAILKSGAFRLVGARYGVQKLDSNTHLYTSDRLIPDFPGRIFQIKEVCGNAQNINCQLSIVNFRANVIARNYPLSADQLRRKYRITDGGDLYLIGTRLAGKPLLLLATRVK